MHDAEAYRAESRRSWGQAAAGWAKYTPTHMRQAMPVTVRMLDLADVQPGAELLELAAGTGEVGYLALELAQPGGSLITSDFAPEMLTAAQQRATEMGAQAVRFKQIDAESLDLEAASLDVVLCRWGFMFCADPVAALRECRRVLRPGGRLSLATWTGPDENRWSADMARTLIERGHMEPADPDEPGQFALAADGRIEALLREAGWVDGIEIDTVQFAFRETFEDWWERTTTMSRAVREIFAGLDAAEREAARAAAYDRLQDLETAGELTIPARCWVAAATA